MAHTSRQFLDQRTINLFQMLPCELLDQNLCGWQFLRVRQIRYHQTGSDIQCQLCAWSNAKVFLLDVQIGAGYLLIAPGLDTNSSALLTSIRATVHRFQVGQRIPFPSAQIPACGK